MDPCEEGVHSPHRVVLETPQGERTFTPQAGQAIWDAANAHAIVLPAICHQGSCLTCAGRILGGTLDHSNARAYFQEDAEAGFALLCVGIPCTDVRIRTHQEDAMRRHRLQLGLPAPYI